MTSEKPLTALTILGGGRTPDGNLTELSIQRLTFGMHIFNQLPSRRVFVSLGGGYSTFRPGAVKFQLTGADQKADFLIKLGMPDNDIIRFPYGGDTILEAFATALALRDTHPTTLTVVTSTEHAQRSLLCFTEAWRRINTHPIRINMEGITSQGKMDQGLEAEIFSLTKDFWRKLPVNIHPTPDNWWGWYEENRDFYTRQEQLIAARKSPQQAYQGIK